MDDLYVVVTDKMVDAGWAKFRDFDDGEGIYRNHLKQVIEAALAAQPALTPTDGGWLPIATAPRNGSDVDLSSHDGTRWANCHFHCGEWLFWDYRGVDDEPSWTAVAKPTHWRPLPLPPRQSAAANPTPSDPVAIVERLRGEYVERFRVGGGYRFKIEAAEEILAALRTAAATQIPKDDGSFHPCPAQVS